MFDNEIATKFAKRFANASLVIQQSPLPQSTQELVSLVALINAAKRLAVIVHQQGGSYEPGMFAATFT